MTATVLTVVGLGGLLAWLASGFYLTWRVASVPLLEEALGASERPGPDDVGAAVDAPRLTVVVAGRDEPPGLAGAADAPRLSVVVAVRDEPAGLAGTAASLLAQQHPGLELILVDDRSGPQTAELVDRLAAEHTNVIAVHVGSLPAGWLGKVHALHTGLQRATGEYVLFTDADASFGPGVLERVTRLCAAEQLDHVAVLPQVERRSPGQVVITAAVVTGILARWRPAARDPRRYLGVGPFNLVRRESFLRTAGFEHLRLEVLDDMGVGLLMSAPHHRRRYFASRSLVRFAWYPDGPAMLRGLDKNLFAGLAHYRLPVAAALVGTILAFVATPLAVFAAAGWPWTPPLVATAAMAHLVYAGVAARRLRASFWGHLLLPLGLLGVALGLVRSASLFVLRGGVVWRGTHYPAAELIAHHRVRR